MTQPAQKTDLLATLAALADDNGFELLDTVWSTRQAKYSFKHKEHGTLHAWKANNIFVRGFPKDLRSSTQKHDALADHALKNGFVLKEDHWLGSNTKHRFLHSASQTMYQWVPKQVLGTSGFPKNLRNDAERIKDLTLLAGKNGFKIVDAEWKGWRHKYKFVHLETKKSYDWTATQILDKGFPADLRTNVEKLQELADLALTHGFRLLETQWLGVKTKHRFIHTQSNSSYSGSPDHLMGSSGFPLKFQREWEAMQGLQKLAQDSGFELLDTHWKGYLEKYRFKHLASGVVCAWDIGQIKMQGAMLSVDGLQERRNSTELFEQLKTSAGEQGFELLETNWHGAHAMHSFKNLDTGVVYEWIAANVLYNGFPKDLKTSTQRWSALASYAEEQGFTLLTSTWLGSDKDHDFLKKATGETYSGRPANVMARGFPENLARPGSVQYFLNNAQRLEELRLFALQEGYELLTKEWLGGNCPHEFKHIDSSALYEGRPANILLRGFPLLAGQRYLTEEVCRQAMQHIFGGRFKSNRQRLKEIHGRSMELDGFEVFDSVPNAIDSKGQPFLMNGVLKDGGAMITEVAFEFQGHWTHLENEEVIERDKLRVDYCKKLGILLVVIDAPHDWNKNRDAQYMYEHVCSAVQSAFAMKTPIAFKPDFTIDLRHWNPDLTRYRELVKKALDSGFELLDTEWKGTKEKYRFKNMTTGILYTSPYSRIMSDVGFPKNYLTPLNHFKKIYQFAEKYGFELLESEWLGFAVAHQFRHRTSGFLCVNSPQHLYKHGFPDDLRTTEEKIQELSNKAQEHGFLLLTQNWLGLTYKHRFEHQKSGLIYEWPPSRVLGPKGFPRRLQKNNVVVKTVEKDELALESCIHDLFFEQALPKKEEKHNQPVAVEHENSFGQGMLF